MSLDTHISVLEQYAFSFFGEDPSINKLLQLKLTHSKHVLENAHKITECEDFNDHETKLGLLAALYHDIGRFPQYAQYQTFDDKASVNHGKLGALTLRDLHLPGNLTTQESRLIRFAVAHHNSIRLSPSITRTQRRLTNLVRDADKLDIYRILIPHFMGIDTEPAVTLRLDNNPDAYSEELLSDILEGKMGAYSKAHYVNDFKLIVIGWVNDLNYAASFSLLEKNKYISQVCAMLPRTPQIEKLEEKIGTFINEQVSFLD